MKDSFKFHVVLTVWISLIINIVLSILLPVLAMGFVNAEIFFKGFAIAYTVSTLIFIFVPIAVLGGKFAGIFKLKPFTVPAQLVSTLLVAFILATVMTLLMTAINAGVGPHFLGAWLSCYLYAYLAVYGSALVGIWTGLPLTRKILGVPKPEAGQRAPE